MFYAKDDAGQVYTSSGNDRHAYETFINRLKNAQDSGRVVTLDQSTRMDLARYEPNIFSDYGRLGGRW